MASLGEIDKMFAADGSSTTSGILGKIPMWVRRIVIAYVLSILLLIGLKPKFTLKIEADGSGNVKVSMMKMKVVQYAAVGAALLYFIVQKFY